MTLGLATRHRAADDAIGVVREHDGHERGQHGQAEQRMTNHGPQYIVATRRRPAPLTYAGGPGA